MKMRKFLLILFFPISVSITCRAQQLDYFISIVDKSSFKQLKADIDSISKLDTRNRPVTSVVSDLLPPFYKEVISFQISYSPDNTASYKYKNYFACTIVKDDSIVYLEFRNRNGDMTEKIYGSDKSSRFEELQNLYKDEYYREIELAELFETDIVYGVRCFNSGSKPPYREKLDDLILKGDTSALEYWLGSTNLTIQAYAVEGFYLLTTQKQYKLTDKQYGLISKVKNKKGLIKTCSGCLFSVNDVREVLENYKF